ncbi:Jerky -like [Araneus ventricosus]|uniref:Jerky-like n=1 Tax=Araneus ventricosus TaxID=182803 RepID=A0A4Y2NPS1_ARAVE|nr:Jerky -like [Araneus ventricosus]
MDNVPAHPDVETLKAENITCIFMPPNTTAILQPMDQGVIESMKQYRKQVLRKLLFEGVTMRLMLHIPFWKALTLKDYVYMINKAWESVPELAIKRSWQKLVPYLKNVDQSNDSGSVTVTELNRLLKQIQGCGNSEEDDVSS